MGRNIDAESWARLLVRARGARDIMYRMRCTWETLANVVERRSGGAEQRQNIQTGLSWCFHIPGDVATLRKTGVAAQLKLAHSFLCTL